MPERINKNSGKIIKNGRDSEKCGRKKQVQYIVKEEYRGRMRNWNWAHCTNTIAAIRTH